MGEKSEEKKGRYDPDYITKCQNCDATPTVVYVEPDGNRIEYEMCGPCVFGEAACLDPEEW